MQDDNEDSKYHAFELISDNWIHEREKYIGQNYQKELMVEKYMKCRCCHLI